MEDFTKDFEKYEIKFPQNRKGLRSQNDNWFHLPPSQIAKLWRQGLVKKDRAFNRDDVWKDVDHAAWIRGCQLGHKINTLYFKAICLIVHLVHNFMNVRGDNGFYNLLWNFIRKHSHHNQHISIIFW